MKDLLILKFNGQSKVTMEGYTGYFIIRKSGEIKYKILQYPMSLSSFVECKLNESFKVFQKKLNDAMVKVAKNSPEFKSINSNLNRYVGRKIVRDPSFGMKLLSAYQMKDKMVMKDFIKDFFEEWVEDLNVEIVTEEVYYSEFSKQFSKFSNPEDIASMLERSDLNTLSEAYPIVDPIHGRPITTFDIGDKIYFTVLKFSDEESKKKILEAFPKNFDDNGENVKPLVGTIISKELVSGMKDFILIKIECKDVMFKSVIYSGVNIMWENVRVPQRRDDDKYNDDPAFSKNKQTELKEILKEKDRIKITDVLIAMFLVAGVVLAIMVGIYFFFWK